MRQVFMEKGESKAMNLLFNTRELFNDWYKNGMRFTPDGKKRLRSLLVRLIELLPETDPSQLLTYEGAIQYFVAYRPNNEQIKKGAIMREQHTEGIRIVQLFLDERNEPVYSPQGRPYGRQSIVAKIDKELEGAFGSTDLIIVE